MSVQSSDATHPYRTTCLVDAGYAVGVAEAIRECVEYGRCPRCLAALPSPPPGSRATRCRCVPLCSDCAVDEINPETYTDPNEWPLPGDVRDARTENRNLARDIMRDMDAEPVDPEDSTPQPPDPEYKYGKGDAALDALAMVEAVRLNDARTLGALWDTFEPRQRRTIAAVLASWVITMNGLTALNFDEWAGKVRDAARHLQERGE